MTLNPITHSIVYINIKDLEQGWLAQCQFKVTGWGIMFILLHDCLVCCHLKTRLESIPVTTDLTTTVVRSFKLLINDVKPIHPLTHSSELPMVYWYVIFIWFRPCFYKRQTICIYSYIYINTAVTMKK